MLQSESSLWPLGAGWTREGKAVEMFQAEAKEGGNCGNGEALINEPARPEGGARAGQCEGNSSVLPAHVRSAYTWCRIKMVDETKRRSFLFSPYRRGLSQTAALHPYKPNSQSSQSTQPSPKCILASTDHPLSHPSCSQWVFWAIFVSPSRPCFFKHYQNVIPDKL